jgi:hypothetical protein
MNIVECTELVEKIFAVDGRVINTQARDAWFSAIGHLDRDLAGQAAKACIQEQTQKIVPAHVIAKVKEMKKDKDARRNDEEKIGRRFGENAPICTHGLILIGCMPCQKQLAEESRCRHNLYPIYCDHCQPHFQRLSWTEWQQLKAVI